MNKRIVILVAAGLTSVLTGCAVTPNHPSMVGGSAFESEGLQAVDAATHFEFSKTARPVAIGKRCGEVPCSAWEVPLGVELTDDGILPSVSLEMTPEVRRELEHFQKKDREFIPRSLTAGKAMYPKIKQIFDNHRVPQELINVAMIESAYKVNAGSSAGAVGLWQFMKSTAATYGLKTGKSDERKDPIRSSIAAARHLTDLYQEFGDWLLALAAYNAGVGRIKRALAKTKGGSFWELVRAGGLNEQTARYVPKFIAVTLITRDPARYGFGDVPELVDGNMRVS